MLEVNWKEIIKIDKNDPNYSFNEFEKKVNIIIDNYIPLKKLNKKEIKQLSKPWISLGIRNSIRRRDLLYKKFIKAKSNDKKIEYHANYKKLRNTIVTLCRVSKRNYYHNYFAKNANNLKKTWKGIKNLIHLSQKNKTESTSLMIEEKLLTDPKEVANEYNNYFSTIANKLREGIHSHNPNFRSYLLNSNEKNFFIFPTNKEEVEDLIDEIDCSKSIGPHSLPTNIFKYIKLIISESLSDIINLSFSTGIAIENLKTSKVIPIYKGKGSNLSYCNYRPISLLSNIDKLVEKLMFKRLYSFLTKYKIIYSLQFGFRENHSTNHTLIYLTETVRNALDNNCYASGIFVDLQKAFDTVDHDILLYKLNHYGIRGIENKWFKSFLSNRRQFVSIDGINSSDTIVEHGVPQGSVLGPLLFLLYINDLNKAIKHCKTIHFADDTCLILKNKSLKQMRKYLNVDLRNLSNWLSANKISLNVSKTELLLFRHPNKNINYKLKIKLNGKLLHPSNYVKYLGVYIDPSLNWNFNTNILAAKLTRSIGMLSKIRHYVNRETLKSIYFAIFSSHLTYGSIIWAQNKNNRNVNRIMRLQKRAIRIISFANYRDHADPLFKNLNILKLTHIVELQNMLLVYDSLNSKLPSILNNVYKTIQSSHSYNTRNSIKLKLYLPEIETEVYGKNSIRYRSIIDWNNILDISPTPLLHTFSRSVVKNIMLPYLFRKYV